MALYPKKRTKIRRGVHLIFEESSNHFVGEVLLMCSAHEEMLGS
jgi:hypothetical protein